MYERLRHLLTRPADIRPLAWFRIAFGLLIFGELVRLMINGETKVLGDELMHFTYYGFSWVKPPPGAMIHVLAGTAAAAALFAAAGLFYRAAAAALFLSWTYLFLIEKAVYLNHFYLIALLAFLMVLLPAHRTLSLDALRRPALRSSFLPGWQWRLLQFQVALPYVYGGLAKIDRDWLAAKPLAIWLKDVSTAPWLPYAFAYGGLFFDLAVVPMLFLRRTRRVAILSMLAFHAANSLLFDIGVFPWLMIAATLIVLRPDGPMPSAAAVGHRRAPRYATTLAAAYVLIHLIIPWRHLLYAGDANWTNEGHWFAWRMMLRVKEARAEFLVIDQTSGRAWSVDPEASLAPVQARVMPNDPDMILQFAHAVSMNFKERGIDDVAVHARIEASLNGGPWRPFVDQRVDLAAEPRGLAEKRWIIPLTQ
jgi:hypothetical protein